MTQLEVARQTGLTEQYISGLENGRKNFEFDKMLDIAAVIEMPLCEVYSDKMFIEATKVLEKARKGNDV